MDTAALPYAGKFAPAYEGYLGSSSLTCQLPRIGQGRIVVGDGQLLHASFSSKRNQCTWRQSAVGKQAMAVKIKDGQCRHSRERFRGGNLT